MGEVSTKVTLGHLGVKGMPKRFVVRAVFRRDTVEISDDLNWNRCYTLTREEALVFAKEILRRFPLELLAGIPED